MRICLGLLDLYDLVLWRETMDRARPMNHPAGSDMQNRTPIDSPFPVASGLRDPRVPETSWTLHLWPCCGAERCWFFWTECLCVQHNPPLGPLWVSSSCYETLSWEQATPDIVGVGGALWSLPAAVRLHPGAPGWACGGRVVSCCRRAGRAAAGGQRRQRSGGAAQGRPPLVPAWPVPGCWTFPLAAGTQWVTAELTGQRRGHWLVADQIIHDTADLTTSNR